MKELLLTASQRMILRYTLKFKTKASLLGAFFLAHFFIALRIPLRLVAGFFGANFCRDLQPCFLHEGKLGQVGHFVNDMAVALG